MARDCGPQRLLVEERYYLASYTIVFLPMECRVSYIPCLPLSNQLGLSCLGFAANANYCKYLYRSMPEYFRPLSRLPLISYHHLLTYLLTSQLWQASRSLFVSLFTLLVVCPAQTIHSLVLILIPVNDPIFVRNEQQVTQSFVGYSCLTI